MYNKIMRYHEDVFITLCCQHCIQTGKMVDGQLVMRWLQVSKPTALQVLNEYVERGYMTKHAHQWRNNARKHSFRPSKSCFTAYRRGEYREKYLQWMRTAI